jgi:hypothetical protein
MEENLGVEFFVREGGNLLPLYILTLLDAIYSSIHIISTRFKT